MPKGKGTYGKKKGRPPKNPFAGKTPKKTTKTYPTKGKANVKKLNAQLKANRKLKKSKGQLGDKLYEYQTGYGAAQASHESHPSIGPRIVRASSAAAQDIRKGRARMGKGVKGYGHGYDRKKAPVRKRGSKRQAGNIEAGMN